MVRWLVEVVLLLEFAFVIVGRLCVEGLLLLRFRWVILQQGPCVLHAVSLGGEVRLLVLVILFQYPVDRGLDLLFVFVSSAVASIVVGLIRPLCKHIPQRIEVVSLRRL